MIQLYNTLTEARRPFRVVVVEQPFSFFRSRLDQRRGFAGRCQTFDHLENLERSRLRVDLEAAVPDPSVGLVVVIYPNTQVHVTLGRMDNHARSLLPTPNR